MAGIAQPPTETELRNRRITAVVLLVAAAVGILALADLGPFADETEEDRVRDVVERFIEARDEDDFQTECDLLTVPLKRQVQATSGARPGEKPPGCTQVLSAQAEAQGEDEGPQAREIVDVNVSGNRARVAVEESEGISQSIALELVDGEWLISTFER